jgi:hypothetical protein
MWQLAGSTACWNAWVALLGAVCGPLCSIPRSASGIASAGGGWQLRWQVRAPSRWHGNASSACICRMQLPHSAAMLRCIWALISSKAHLVVVAVRLSSLLSIIGSLYPIPRTCRIDQAAIALQHVGLRRGRCTGSTGAGHPGASARGAVGTPWGMPQSATTASCMEWWLHHTLMLVSSRFDSLPPLLPLSAGSLLACCPITL